MVAMKLVGTNPLLRYSMPSGAEAEHISSRLKPSSIHSILLHLNELRCETFTTKILKSLQCPYSSWFNHDHDPAWLLHRASHDYYCFLTLLISFRRKQRNRWPINGSKQQVKKHEKATPKQPHYNSKNRRHRKKMKQVASICNQFIVYNHLFIYIHIYIHIYIYIYIWYAGRIRALQLSRQQLSCWPGCCTEFGNWSRTGFLAQADAAHEQFDSVQESAKKVTEFLGRCQQTDKRYSSITNSAFSKIAVHGRMISSLSFRENPWFESPHDYDCPNLW